MSNDARLPGMQGASPASPLSHLSSSPFSPSSSSSSWSPGRRLVAVVFGLLAWGLLAVLTVHLAGALFLLLNRADPSQAGFGSILPYWQHYGDDPRQLKRLRLALGFPAAVLLVALPAAALVALTVAGGRRPLHGDARFAKPAEVRAALPPARGRPAQSRPAILLGRHRGRLLSLPGQLSVLLAAPPRSGKGVGVVIPNLLNWPDSVVVLDVKGENHAITAGFRAAHGQPVYAFSPFDDEGRSHRWNPLSAVRATTLHRVGDLLALGQVLYPNDGGGTTTEAFFNDQARNLFMGLGLLLLETPTLPRTLGEMLRQASGRGRPLSEHLWALLRRRAPRNESTARSPDLDAEPNDESRCGRHNGPPLTSECADALQRLLANSDNTLSGIVATFAAPLTIFADAIVDAATDGDDFRLEDVRRRRMSVYVRIPPSRLATARPLLNLFFSQLVNLNTRHLPEHDASLRYQCLIVNDEFTAMGRVAAITQAAAYLPGYNLRLLTIIQAMSQLDAVYGDKEARAFATSHGLQILFAPREQRDAEEYSAMLGQFTERATSHGRSRSLGPQGHASTSRNDSDQRRALLLPQEFRELGSEREVLILENAKPILAEKIRYHREPAFRARLLPAPEVPRLDLEGHLVHLARVRAAARPARPAQGRSESEGEQEPDDELEVRRLALDLANLPLDLDRPDAEIARSIANFFFDSKSHPTAAPLGSAAGGSVETLDEDAMDAAPSHPVPA